MPKEQNPCLRVQCEETKRSKANPLLIFDSQVHRRPSISSVFPALLNTAQVQGEEHKSKRNPAEGLKNLNAAGQNHCVGFAEET